MSKIEWTDVTWNPITGCSPTSEGCEHCYAERMAHRLAGRFGYPGDDPFRVTLHGDRLDDPFHWRKPRKVFVCSMGDLFHEDVPDVYRDSVLFPMYVLDAEPLHTWILLTKRPGRAREYLGGRPPLPPNVWLGVTAENQQRADERIPILLDTPAAKRFVSCEPMLGPVDLTRCSVADDIRHDVLQSYQAERHKNGHWEHIAARFPALDWVICGAETGPGARPMQPRWAHDLWEQCLAAGVPFFFKKGTPGLSYDPDMLETREWPGG